MEKSEQLKANEPAQEVSPVGGSIDPRTQGYVDGVVYVKKSEIKQELAEELKKEIDSTAKKIESDLQDFINQNQTRVIEALAVFVALFTFVSVNIQVLSKVIDLRSAAIFMTFMAFLTMIIVSFPLFLLRVVRDDSPPRWVWLTLLISIILLLVVLVLTFGLNIPLNSSP